MTDNVPAQSWLNEEAARAKRKFKLSLVPAVCWPISATIMWATFALGSSWTIAGAIAFSGVAMMYIMMTFNSYYSYIKADTQAKLHT